MQSRPCSDRNNPFLNKEYLIPAGVIGKTDAFRNKDRLVSGRFVQRQRPGFNMSPRKIVSIAPCRGRTGYGICRTREKKHRYSQYN